MRKINRVRIPALPGAESKDRQELIKLAVVTPTKAYMGTAMTVIALSALGVYNKTYGESKVIDSDLVDDIKTISRSMMFELNEATPIDIDVADGLLSNILNRLLPIIPETPTLDKILLMFGSTGIDSNTMDELNDKRYYSDAVFNVLIKLFKLTDRYLLELDTDGIMNIIKPI